MTDDGDAVLTRAAARRVRRRRCLTPAALLRALARRQWLAPLVLLLAALALPHASHAQEPDTVFALPDTPVTRPQPDEPRPPLTPPGAFLRSFLVPGWAQHVLDRPRAGALFVTAEFVSAVMMIDARQRLALARRWGRDSIIVGWEPPTGPGQPPRAITIEGPLAGRTDPRRQQVEDWMAILIFNHLVAGADAFVAAHLWELPVHLEIRRDALGTHVGARITWQP